jgi:serine/threonine-protein kinase HipA
MMPSKLIDDKHFATLRFDRKNGEKQHILTACGMTGWDFKKSEHSSYENLFMLAVDLKLPNKDIEQLFKRMVFNVVFCNIDDHLKNFSFLYNKEKDRWNLAPAYDLTYPLDALKNYTRISRAMSINGKRGEITKKDILKIADQFTMKNAERIIHTIGNAIPTFEILSKSQKIPEKVIAKIMSDFNGFF